MSELEKAFTLAKGKKNSIVNIRLTSEQKSALKNAAEKMGMTTSQFINNAVVRYSQTEVM